MITASFSLDWKGDPYKRKLLRELQRATRQGAERVLRNAKQEQLNTSGKAATTKAGLNKGDTQARKDREIYMHDLKTVASKKTGASLQFGGTYRFFTKSAYGSNVKWFKVKRVYWYGDPLHRWVQSSQPGSPPHKQTGTLQRSIAVQVEGHGMKAKIGPGQRLIYGRIQELGGRGLINLPPRPYMRPALLAEAQRVLFGYQLAVARASQ